MLVIKGNQGEIIPKKYSGEYNGYLMGNKNISGNRLSLKQIVNYPNAIVVAKDENQIYEYWQKGYYQIRGRYNLSGKTDGSILIINSIVKV